MALTKDSVLFYQDFGRGRLDPIVGGLPTFLRAGGAWKFDGRLFRKVIRNQPRFEPVELNDGRRQAGLLLEPATEQELAAPFDFADASWTKFNGAARTDAESLLEGETASKLAGDGATTAPGMYANKTLTGSSETATWIIEQGGEAAFRVGLFDATAGAWITRYTITWSTLATSLNNGTTAEQISVRELAAVGPNGGKVVLVRITDTGTGSNTGRPYCYPIADGTTGHAFVHYVGWEENAYGSRPLDGPANTAQARDDLIYANAPLPQRKVWYARWIHGMPGNGGVSGPRIFQLGQGINDDPRFLLYIPADNTVGAFHDNGTSAVSSAVALAGDLAPGDDVEAIAVLAADGDVRVIARVNGGSEVAGSLTTGAPALLSAWGGAGNVEVGQADGSVQGRISPVRLFAAVSADMDNDPETAAAADVMDELAATYLTPAGELI